MTLISTEAMNKPLQTEIFNHNSFWGIDFLHNDTDLWLPFYGGNKVRKFIQIEREVAAFGKNAVVTTGGIQSNHCRTAALFSVKNGWKCVLVLHGAEDEFYKQKGNALLMRMSGAECIFVEPNHIGPAMDNAMINLEERGFKPFYVYGGGHTGAGVRAYTERVKELGGLIEDRDVPDHIFLASGTGSTQAGIMSGLKEAGWTKTRVHGISVARNSESGIAGVIEAAAMTGKGYGNDQVDFYDQYLFGGYGKYTVQLREFIQSVAENTGIILDTTYSGKAFYGMIDLIQKRQLEGKFLFWNTGGLLNLMA